MTGVVLQLDAVAGRLAAGDSSTVALSDLPSALGSRAGQALTETRQSVAAMRASPRAQPLHEQLATAAQRTFSGTEILVRFTQTERYGATRRWSGRRSSASPVRR
jgi:hypothetical protein